jgi:hypothetical protein
MTRRSCDSDKARMRPKSAPRNPRNFRCAEVRALPPLAKHDDARGCRHHLTQQFESLCRQVSRQIAARGARVANKTEPDRLVANIEHDGDRRGCRLGLQCRGRTKATMTATRVERIRRRTPAAAPFWSSAPRYSIAMFSPARQPCHHSQFIAAVPCNTNNAPCCFPAIPKNAPCSLGRVELFPRS